MLFDHAKKAHNFQVILLLFKRFFDFLIKAVNKKIK